MTKEGLRSRTTKLVEMEIEFIWIMFPNLVNGEMVIQS